MHEDNGSVALLGCLCDALGTSRSSSLTKYADIRPGLQRTCECQRYSDVVLSSTQLGLLWLAQTLERRLEAGFVAPQFLRLPPCSYAEVP